MVRMVPYFLSLVDEVALETQIVVGPCFPKLCKISTTYTIHTVAESNTYWTTAQWLLQYTMQSRGSRCKHRSHRSKVGAKEEPPTLQLTMVPTMMTATGSEGTCRNLFYVMRFQSIVDEVQNG